jgi:cytochrome P450
VKASDNTTSEDKLSEEEFLGQMNVIVFAGTDTTSTAVSRALQELARHPDIQAQLREEVTKAAVHGDLDYDALCALPFLEAVCRETLRMCVDPDCVLCMVNMERIGTLRPSPPAAKREYFPPTALTWQVNTCSHSTKDTFVPLSTPMVGVNGTYITEIFVPAGTIVHIGIKAANTRRAVWGPDALEWNPQRWLAPLPSAVMEAQIPGVYTKL